jgi:hypothetical protein
MWIARAVALGRTASGDAELVPGEGIEPPTFGLQNRCSTAELTRHIKGLAPERAGNWARLDPIGTQSAFYSPAAALAASSPMTAAALASELAVRLA